MTDNCKEQLKQQCEAIAWDIQKAERDDCPDCGAEIIENEDGYENHCVKCDWQGSQNMNAFDYLGDVLDIEYTTDSKKEYLGARVLVAFGGPNIWINTRTKTIEGHWWGDTVYANYTQDNIGLDDALAEIYAC